MTSVVDYAKKSLIVFLNLCRRYITLFFRVRCLCVAVHFRRENLIAIVASFILSKIFTMR